MYVIVCIKCNAILQQEPRELFQDNEVCFRCFSQIEDWQDQCTVSEEQLIKELNV